MLRGDNQGRSVFHVNGNNAWARIGAEGNEGDIEVKDGQGRGVFHMDGANAWQQFKSITLPMLAPTTVFVSIIAMIGNFQLFTEPYVMTQGGPVNSTLSIVLLMYQQGFRWWNLGYSAAIAFVLFGVILLGSLIQSRLQNRA